MGRATAIQCHESGDDVSVLELLDGVKLDHLPVWAAPSRPKRTIRIFLASSEELRADRDELERYFRQQTDQFRKRGIHHGQFKKAHKPLIYTFFRETSIPATEQGQANLATLLAFQKKLKDLGHFWTRYENIEHLKRQFKDQLEKLEETNFEGHGLVS